MALGSGPRVRGRDRAARHARIPGIPGGLERGAPSGPPSSVAEADRPARADPYQRSTMAPPVRAVGARCRWRSTDAFTAIAGRTDALLRPAGARVSPAVRRRDHSLLCDDRAGPSV